MTGNSLNKSKKAPKKPQSPKQKRSIETKNKLKRAAKQLFSKQGYYNVTSNMIAEKAKVPIGSFYNYFGDKKIILLELIKDFQANYMKENLKYSFENFKKMKIKKDVLKNITSLLRIFLLSKHVSDPFYKIIHSLQYIENDVLKLNEEIRDAKLEVFSKFISSINHIHPIKNIPIKAKLIHSTAENIGLYIALGTPFEKEQLISETAKMLNEYLFSD